MDKKAKERVLIAKDALAWIEAEALLPETGSYLNPTYLPKENDINSNKQLRDIVLGQCRVCAKGALFLAKAVRYDNVLVNQWHDANRGVNGPLNEHFSVQQLELIESTFEGWHGTATYLDRYPDPKDRLVVILKNIIANKGTFIYGR